MPIANGIAKKVRYKRQVTFGAPVASSGGQAIRRVTSDIELTKNTFRSNEIRDDQQRLDMRHGMHVVGGKIAGELSAGTYGDFMETFCRQAWQAGATTGALITVAAAVSGVGGTFTRSAGSYLTDGFKVGDVVRWTGWLAPATGNNANNFFITALSALVMTGQFLNASPVTTRVAGDSVTCTLAGKKTWVPLSGHTNDCYTVEHWYSDIGQSEVFDSCRVGTMNINLPPTGLATLDIGFVGRDMTPGTSAYFATPTAATTTSDMGAVNGLLVVNGTAVAILTGFSIAGNGNATTGEVVGSNTTPDVFMGAVDVTGQITAYFQDSSLRDLFVNETEASVVCAFTSGSSGTADVVAFALPRIKVGGASKDDGEKGITLTMPFTALLNSAGGAGTSSLATTLSIQDTTR